MPDSQLKGLKKGVLLINQRIFIPVELPLLARFEKLDCTPRISLVTREQATWLYSGQLQVAIAYSTAKPQDRGFRDPANGQINHQVKDFFDDGFSDHDEFAEEEVVLSDDVLVRDRLNVVLETVLFEETLEFTGRSPAGDLSLPNPECLLLRVRDMEIKVRDERTLDLAIVLVVETDQQTPTEMGVEVLAFRHPLTISSWPPGMAEVMEWQTAFNEEQILFRDNEILLNGEFLIQVIGLEKEGGEREFSEIITKSLVSWNVELPPVVNRELIQGLKVSVNEIREDAGGLSVYGALYLDMMSASLLSNEAQELQGIQELQDSQESRELKFVERADPEGEVDNTPQEFGEQVFAEIEAKDNADATLQANPEPEVQSDTESEVQFSTVPEVQSTVTSVPQLPTESLDLAVPASEQFEGTIGWLNEWVAGQELEAAEIGTLHMDPPEEPALPVSANIAEVHAITGIYSGDVDPESAELLSSFEITLGEIPTLEDIMDQPESLNVQEMVEINQEQAAVKYNLTYHGQTKNKIDDPSTASTMRQGLTRLKYINKVNLPEQAMEVSSVVAETAISGSPTKPTGRWKLYLVKAGDTVGTISEQYCIEPETLRNRNKLSEDSLENVNSIWIPK